MGTPEKIYELVKALPENQAAEVLDFVEFLQQKAQLQAASQSRLPIPEGTLTGLRGIAKPTADDSLDFRQTAGLGQEIWQSVDVEQYMQQERAAWD